MELIFKLAPEEANLVGEALSRMPYAQVFQLIPKLQSQATEQEAPKEVPVDGN